MTLAPSSPPDPAPIAWGVWLPWLLGAMATWVSLSVAYSLDNVKDAIGSVLAWGVPAVAFAAGAAFARSRLPDKPWAVAGMFYMGIPFGVVLDVLVDHWLTGSHDRDLLPIEIARVCVVAAVPVAAGIVAGRFFQSSPAVAPAPVRDVAGASVVQGPALWNPLAIGLWSLVFTPVLGAFLQMRNWQALGDARKAALARIWLLAWLSIGLFGWLASLLAGHSRWVTGAGESIEAVILIAWWAMPTYEQIQHVRQQYGVAYVHRAWGDPLFVAAGAISAVFLVHMLAAPLVQSMLHP